MITAVFLGCPGGSDHKESACNAGDLGSIPGLREKNIPGEENSYPRQYSCLETSTNRGAWQAQSMRWQRVGHNCMTCTL